MNSSFLQRRRAPSFLIIGTQKGGTTSFFHHLAKHPQLVSSVEKELCFFNKMAIYERGKDWYHEQFPKIALWSRKLVFEASPAYLYYPGTARRIADYAPQMKLIAMLRDPVDRAYSAWNMHRQLWKESPGVLHERLQTQTESVRRDMLAYCETLNSIDFTSAVRKSIRDMETNELEPGLLKRGLYASQIEEYYRHFPKEQLLILESSACRRNLSGELDRVADFLEIRRITWSRLRIRAADHHQRTYEEKMPDEARSLLKEFFRQPNEDLFTLLGERYAWNE